MKSLDAHPQLASMLRVLRIMVIAIAAGLALFLGIVAWLHFAQGQDQPPEGAGLLTNLALALAGIAILGVTLVRSSLVRSALAAWRADDAQVFQQKYATAVILGAVGIEGAGFLLAVAFLLEKDVMAFTAACICLLLILISLPSRNRLEAMLSQLP